MVVHLIQVLAEHKLLVELAVHQRVTHCQVMQEVSTRAEMLAMIPVVAVVATGVVAAAEITAAAVVDQVLLIRDPLRVGIQVRALSPSQELPLASSISSAMTAMEIQVVQYQTQHNLL
jgi:hypothetical protein